MYLSKSTYNFYFVLRYCAPLLCPKAMLGSIQDITHLTQDGRRAARPLWSSARDLRQAGCSGSSCGSTMGLHTHSPQQSHARARVHTRARAHTRALTATEPHTSTHRNKATHEHPRTHKHSHSPEPHTSTHTDRHGATHEHSHEHSPQQSPGTVHRPQTRACKQNGETAPSLPEGNM